MKLNVLLQREKTLQEITQVCGQKKFLPEELQVLYAEALFTIINGNKFCVCLRASMCKIGALCWKPYKGGLSQHVLVEYLVQ